MHNQAAIDTQFIPATAPGIAKAAQLIARGGLVGFATETVYGLGADATSDDAVARIFAAKDRPSFNPLIVHFASVAAARQEVIFDARAEKLATSLWPGALTLVLPRQPNSRLSLLVSAGLDTVAVRVPAHLSAKQMIEDAGKPVAAPSANKSGTISPTQAEHVMESLGGRIDAVLDGGPCAVGLESTVLDLSATQATLLRPGGITRDQIEAVIGPIAEADQSDDDPKAPRSPGMLLRHYAPKKPLRLNARTAKDDEVLIGFGPTHDPHNNLSITGDLVEAASNLFAMLRQLDTTDAPALAVAPIPETGLGRAINDRLRRAATPHERPDL